MVSHYSYLSQDWIDDPYNHYKQNSFLTMMTASNIYKTIGKNDYVCTLSLSPQSEWHKKCLSFITGRIIYTKAERELLDSSTDAEIDEKAGNVLKFDILNDNVAIDDRMKLKLDGIEFSDILEVLYMPFDGNTTKIDELGFKKVPNVIEIQIPDKIESKYESLAYNLYSRIIDSGHRLTHDEIMEYVGLECAFTGGRTRSELLKRLNTNLEAVQASPLFWKSYYDAKSHLTGLNAEEKLRFEIRKNEELLRRLHLLQEELSKSGLSFPLSKEDEAKLKGIQKEIENYKTLRFGFDPLIYCDLETYLHIALRHLPEAKLGELNKGKTDIPYKSSDLKMLIQGVLDSIEAEIVHHFKNEPGRKFYRSGARAIYFNGDYYSIDIDEDGRILSFYRN